MDKSKYPLDFEDHYLSTWITTCTHMHQESHTLTGRSVKRIYTMENLRNKLTFLLVVVATGHQTVVSGVTCPSGYNSLSGNCYVTGSSAMTFSDGVAFCASQSGTMATISGGAENSDLEAYLGDQDVWLGLVRAGSPGWSWLDGSGSPYREWREDEPSGSGECCFMDNDGLWIACSCSLTKVPLCTPGGGIFVGEITTIPQSSPLATTESVTSEVTPTHSPCGATVLESGIAAASFSDDHHPKVPSFAKFRCASECLRDPLCSHFQVTSPLFTCTLFTGCFLPNISHSWVLKINK